MFLRISVQAGCRSARAVRTVSRSRSPAIVQADAADVGTGVELAHEAFDDAGGQLGAAEAGQRLWSVPGFLDTDLGCQLADVSIS